MVHKTILNKLKIPFATLSTTALLSLFGNKVLASANDINNPLLKGRDIVTEMNPGQSATSNDSVIESIRELPTIVDSIEQKIAEFEAFIVKFQEGIQWIKDFPQNLPQYSAELFSQIYELITKIILQTPTFLFDNHYFQEATLTFSVVSISIVTLLTMIESIKKMLRQKHTDFKQILKRYALVVPTIGFAPFLFEKGFDLLNKFTEAILKIGSAGMTSVEMADFMVLNGFNTGVLIVFDLAILALCIPIFFQNGRRWFDILTLTILTPLSLTAWIFDNYRHLHQKWWSSLKKLSLTQLVYAVYIVILTLFILGTSQIQNGEALLVKMLIISGGLWRMLNPPHFVLSMVDEGKDVFEMFGNFKKTFMTAKDTITLKKVKPFQILKRKWKTRKK